MPHKTLYLQSYSDHDRLHSRLVCVNDGGNDHCNDCIQQLHSKRFGRISNYNHPISWEIGVDSIYGGGGGGGGTLFMECVNISKLEKLDPKSISSS